MLITLEMCFKYRFLRLPLWDGRHICHFHQKYWYFRLAPQLWNRRDICNLTIRPSKNIGFRITAELKDPPFPVAAQQGVPDSLDTGWARKHRIVEVSTLINWDNKQWYLTVYLWTFWRRIWEKRIYLLSVGWSLESNVGILNGTLYERFSV